MHKIIKIPETLTSNSKYDLICNEDESIASIYYRLVQVSIKQLLINDELTAAEIINILRAHIVPKQKHSFSNLKLEYMSEQAEVLANAMIQLSTITAEYEKQDLLVKHESNLKDIYPQYIQDSFYKLQ